MSKVSTPIAQYMGRQYSSWVPWCMVYNSTDPTEPLLSVDGFQLLLKGDTTRDILCSHVADVTPPTVYLKNRI